MTVYAKVDGTTILKYNVSEKEARKGLVNFTGDFAAHGFLPIVGNEPVYDRVLENCAGPEYEVGETEVTRVYVVTDKTEQELADQLASAVASAKEQLAAHSDASVKIIVGSVSNVSRDGWPVKEVAARAYLANSETVSAEDEAMLQAEANITGETLTDLSTAIVARATGFRTISGAVTGVERTAGAAMDVATDIATVDAALATGIASIDAIVAAALGT